MTEKELHKLNRQDLLQLLLNQSKQAADLRVKLDESLKSQEETEQVNERLKAKLDEKDAAHDEQNGRLKDKLNEKDEQLEHLKAKLDEKDAQLERLKGKLNEKDEQLERLKERLGEKEERIRTLQDSLEAERRYQLEKATEPGNIAEEALRISGIFEAAEKAVEIYKRALERTAED